MRAVFFSPVLNCFSSLLLSLIIVCITICSHAAAEEAKKPEKNEEKKMIPDVQVPVGEMPNYQLGVRMFNKPKDYVKKALGGKKFQEYYTFTKSCRVRRDTPSEPPEKAAKYDVRKKSALVYVPKAYDAAKGWGIYIHLGEDQKGQLPAEWKPILDKYKLIYASPHDTPTVLSDIYRMAVLLDTLATLQKEYQIDENRVYIGGDGTGASVALIAAINYPTYFDGVIAQAGSMLLRKVVYQESMGAIGAVTRAELAWDNESPYLTSKYYPKIQKAGVRFVFYVAGRTDRVHERAVRGAYTFYQAGFRCRLFDEPKGTLSIAPPDWLEKSILWLQGEKVESLPARFDQYKLRWPHEKNR